MVSVARCEAKPHFLTALVHEALADLLKPSNVLRIPKLGF
jgi:hypothetical protein